jgi:hypothetical protein
LDITYADNDVPIVTVQVAELLSSISSKDIQRIPVKVDGHDEQYEIINLIHSPKCIDTKRSEIEWYEEGNDIRPDLAGTPEMITRLIIDPSRTQNHQIFRPDGWDVVVVASDDVKKAFESAGVSGVKFKKVS